MVDPRDQGDLPAASSSERQRWGIEGFELGIALGGPTSAEAWPDQLKWVDHAESLGLHSVWLPEMHFAQGACPAPLLGLAAFAGRTRRLRLATSSLLLPLHHPLHVAQHAAAVDQLSGGRLILGLGRGFRKALFEAFGVEAAQKRDLFDAALDRILAAWQPRPDAAGSSGEAGMPLPLQRPHPPLAVAAFGRKGLKQAARRGLPYLASPMEPLAQLRENLAFHREHLSTGDVDRAVPVMRIVYVAADDAESARVEASLEHEARQLARARSGAKVPDALRRAASAPIAERCIVGTSTRVADQIDECREALGVNLLVARTQVGGVATAQQMASLERLAALTRSAS